MIQGQSLRSVAGIALITFLFSSCDLTTPPPPKRLVAPAATEALGTEQGFSLPTEGRLAALKITIANPPADLLDAQDAGILTLKRKGKRDSDRLIFLNDHLAAFALEPGVYRIEAIAGYACGDLFLSLPDRPAPLSLGSLTLTASGEEAAILSGAIPAPEDLDAIARLVGTDPSAIESQPLERRQGARCSRAPWAASRPDIDPNARVFTPLEIAEGVILFGLVGAASGAAIASGSFIFATGASGGVLAVGF